MGDACVWQLAHAQRFAAVAKVERLSIARHWPVARRFGVLFVAVFGERYMLGIRAAATLEKPQLVRDHVKMNR